MEDTSLAAPARLRSQQAEWVESGAKLRFRAYSFDAVTRHAFAVGRLSDLADTDAPVGSRRVSSIREFLPSFGQRASPAIHGPDKSGCDLRDHSPCCSACVDAPHA